jgi:hypothetical protein
MGKTIDFNFCKDAIPQTSNPPCSIDDSFAHLYYNDKCFSFKNPGEVDDTFATDLKDQDEQKVGITLHYKGGNSICEEDPA